MYQVIFAHLSDNNESVIYEGTKAECMAEVARLKHRAESYDNFTTWRWCNGGFCVPNYYYVELREMPEPSVEEEITALINAVITVKIGVSGADDAESVRVHTLLSEAITKLQQARASTYTAKRTLARFNDGLV